MNVDLLTISSYAKIAETINFCFGFWFHQGLFWTL